MKGNLVRMTKHCAISLLAGLMLSKVAWAQTDAQALESALKDKQMVLRSYSADTVARYDWVDSKLVANPVKMYTFGMFITRSVKLKNGKLVLDGERGTFVRNVKTNEIFLAGKMPMKLEVNLHDAAPAVVIQHLQEMMFFPDAQAAATGLPEMVADDVPFDISRTPQEKRDFVKVFDGGRWTRLDRHSTKIVTPKLVFSVEPEFSDEARNVKINGSVRFAFYVSETGHVGEIWLVSPLGLGLDERAANAVRQYVFKPEQCNGRPVGVAVTVDVNYQIF
ncbi:MAG TPA: energy transducer TonB [Edaphobacter sp.]